MYVTADSVESYLLLGLVKRRYVRIFMNSQPIQHTIYTRQFPYYKTSKNGANTLIEQTGKPDQYLLMH